MKDLALASQHFGIVGATMARNAEELAEDIASLRRHWPNYGEAPEEVRAVIADALTALEAARLSVAAAVRACVAIPEEVSRVG